MLSNQTKPLGVCFHIKSTPPPAPTPQPTYPKKSHKVRNIVIGVVVLIIALVFVGAFVVALVNRSSSNTSLSGAPSVCSSIFQPHSTDVVSGVVSVPPGQSVYYTFTVPSDATSATVHGSFTASGGSGNDIKVYIMDNTNFINWQNGHQANTYYNSGQVTTDQFSVSLSPGTYYLVYDNTFSTFSAKNVQTTVTLSYNVPMSTCG